MMLWNYRLVAIGDRVGLYEIFYEPDGQILACGQDPITLEADSPEELENYLQGLQEALTLPILKMEDLPPIPAPPYCPARYPHRSTLGRVRARDTVVS